MHENKSYATELQDREDLILRILIAATNIKHQPRYLVHVRHSIERLCEK
jgi:hypothetical protein